MVRLFIVLILSVLLLSITIRVGRSHFGVIDFVSCKSSTRANSRTPVNKNCQKFHDNNSKINFFDFKFWHENRMSKHKPLFHAFTPDTHTHTRRISTEILGLLFLREMHFVCLFAFSLCPLYFLSKQNLWEIFLFL